MKTILRLLSVFILFNIALVSCEKEDTSVVDRTNIQKSNDKDFGLVYNTEHNEFLITYDDATYENAGIIEVICKSGTIGEGTGFAHIKIAGSDYTLMWTDDKELVDAYPHNQNRYYNGSYYSLHAGHIAGSYLDC